MSGNERAELLLRDELWVRGRSGRTQKYPGTPRGRARMGLQAEGSVKERGLRVDLYTIELLKITGKSRPAERISLKG